MKYGTYRDFRANKKEPLSDSLVINYNRFCSFFINGSFSDAEISKNIPKNLIRRYLSDYAADMIDRFADVLGGEVGGEAGGEAFADAEEGGAGVGEGLDVALVCDEGGVAVSEKITLRGSKPGTEN